MGIEFNEADGGLIIAGSFDWVNIEMVKKKLEQTHSALNKEEYKKPLHGSSPQLTNS
jgi:hypothetical protein